MRERLFLDTEWATDAMRELVSIALISADGSKRFYAERLPVPEIASSFVRNTVYPLLERGCTALPDLELTAALRSFISDCNNPLIYFDALIDKAQLSKALSGFGKKAEDIPLYEPIHLTRPDVMERVEIYFRQHPFALSRRHHAAVDAEALRWAYMSVQK